MTVGGRAAVQWRELRRERRDRLLILGLYVAEYDFLRTAGLLIEVDCDDEFHRHVLGQLSHFLERLVGLNGQHSGAQEGRSSLMRSQRHVYVALAYSVEKVVRYAPPEIEDRAVS